MRCCCAFFKIRSNSLLQISTAGGLGLGVFSLLTLLLGLSGALNRVTAIAMPIISIAAYLIDWFYRHGKTEFDFSGIKQKLFTEAGLSWFWVFPVVSLAIAIVAGFGDAGHALETTRSASVRCHQLPPADSPGMVRSRANCSGITQCVFVFSLHG